MQWCLGTYIILFSLTYKLKRTFNKGASAQNCFCFPKTSTVYYLLLHSRVNSPSIYWSFEWWHIVKERALEEDLHAWVLRQVSLITGFMSLWVRVLSIGRSRNQPYMIFTCFRNWKDAGIAHKIDERVQQSKEMKRRPGSEVSNSDTYAQRML